MDGIGTAVLVGVAILVIFGILSAIWRPLRKWMTRLWIAAVSLPQKRRKARQDAVLNSARQQVQERSNDLDIDLPWSRDPKWTGPGVRIIYSSGVDRFFVDPYESGIGQYEAGLKSGVLPPDRTSRKTAPRVVERWSLEELEDWLLEHPTPEE